MYVSIKHDNILSTVTINALRLVNIHRIFCNILIFL
jgi:hypothetical protein